MFVSSSYRGMGGSGADLDADVTYGYTNRTPHMKLQRGAYKWLLEQMDSKNILPCRNHTASN